MAVRGKLLSAICVVAALRSELASGQSVAVEVNQTVATSTDDVSAVATQLRSFGEVGNGVRFMGELAWATRSSGESDAFGAGYPYDGHIRVTEAYGERTFQPGGLLVGLRAGRYRTPFGISSGSDQAYLGFLRAPLIRYDDYFALSNNFREDGVDMIVGVPRLTLECSAGLPADVGEASRRSGLDTVVRGQGTLGSLIVGVSYSNTKPYQPEEFAQGRATFTGVDIRFMRDGVQARGEWLTGRPFNGTTTNGGYSDLIIHRPSMGPVTGIVRAEYLAYTAEAPFALSGTRYTVGARISMLRRFTAVFNVIHQSHDLPQRRANSLDVGLTYSARSTSAH